MEKPVRRSQPADLRQPPLKRPEQLLQDARWFEEKVRRAERELRSVTLFTRRRRPARELVYRQALARSMKAPVSDAARAVALASLFSEHERLRRADRINPFDPRPVHLREAWVTEAVAAAASVWGHDDDVSFFVAADVFAPRLEEVLNGFAYVASDVRFESRRTEKTLTIEHAASGLRAKGLLFDGGFGEINSDPDRVRSTSDNTRDGQRYTRLGIGTRIYTWFGHLHPEVRWRYGGPVSVSGTGVRRVLHSQGPLRWEGPCDWCEERGIDWETATPDSFLGHPLEEGENPDAWELD